MIIRFFKERFFSILKRYRIGLCHLAINRRIRLDAGSRYNFNSRRPMVKLIGIFASSGLTGLTLRTTGRFSILNCRCFRSITYCHIAFLQLGRTIVVKEGDFILGGRFFQPCSSIDRIAGNGCNSRTPFERVSDFSRYVLTNWYIIVRQELTFYLHTALVLEDDGIFTFLLLISSRVGYILCNRT